MVLLSNSKSYIVYVQPKWHVNKRLVEQTSMITESEVVEKLFGEIAEQFVGRNGGYTRS